MLDDHVSIDGRRPTTTLRWWTRPEAGANGVSAMTCRVIGDCWSCSPRPVTAPTSRSRSRRDRTRLADRVSAHQRPEGVFDQPDGGGLYRERHTVARANPIADAMALANLLRTDADAHRPLPADSSWSRRSQCWPGRSKTRLERGSLKPVRSHSSSTSRAALAAFQVRGVGLDPARPGRCSQWRPAQPPLRSCPPDRLTSVLRAAGGQRNVDAWAQRLRAIFTSKYPSPVQAVEQAVGKETAALVVCSSTPGIQRCRQPRRGRPRTYRREPGREGVC